MSEIVKDFIKAVKEEKQGTSPYDTPATVTRIDGDTAWVHIAGGVDETPVKLTVNANVGDNVQLRVGGGRAWITGNATAPPTDDTKANVAHGVALKAEDTASAAQIEAVRAKAAADEAEELAEAVHGIAQQAQTDADTAKTNAQTAVTQAQTATAAAQQAQNSLKSVVQGATTVEKAVSVMQTALEAVVDYDAQNDTVQEYFWHDTNGAHVLGDTSGYRNDIKSTGMDIVKVSDEKSYAKFSADGARIGKEYEDGGSNENNMRITKDSIGYYKDGSVNNPVFFVGTETRENLLFYTGLVEVYEPTTETVTIDGYCEPHGDYFYLQPMEGGLPEIEVSVEDLTVTHSSDPSTGNNTTSFTFEYGERIMGVSIYYDITEYAPHFEFSDIERKTDQTTVGGFSANFGTSYSEGMYSFAEGEWSHAIGPNSHAEGFLSVARGNDSHAQNAFTVANGDSQTAIGSANIADTTSLFIIGNGQSDTRRSNALTVDWSGNVEASGDVTDGSGNVLANMPYVDTKANMTYDKVTQALADGKSVFMFDGSYMYVYSSHDTTNNYYWFSRVYGHSGFQRWKIDSSDVWTNEGATNFADYVIEQGTSGIWRYRKWNSGVYECFGTQTASIAVTTSSAGYGGYRSGKLSIPTFPITFATTPTVTATVGSGSQGCWVNNVQPTTTGGHYYLSSGASSAATNRNIQFQVMGRWK